MPAKLNNIKVDERISNAGLPYKSTEPYKGTLTPIKFLCTKHNISFECQPILLIHFHSFSCPMCKKEEKLKSISNRLTNDIIDNRIKEQKRTIVRIGEYTNAKEKLEWKCTKCNHHWFGFIDRILGKPKQDCPKCTIFIHPNTNTNEIIDEKIKLFGLKIKRLGDYKNNCTKIEWQCEKGHTWLARPMLIIYAKTGCPHCKNKKETIVKNILLDNLKNIIKTFIYQKNIRYNNRKYLVDFYIETETNKYIIEYNGEQHYRPINFSGHASKEELENAFSAQKIRDATIKIYCKENNIVFVEIPYSMTNGEIIQEINKIQ